ncbi:hypothetical protein HOG17_01800 [Candidatus Peregrinibacteria bacterium]|jgi:hypothetical protein|nr:hypothetical protein [Candidatus Peregrinibacteria bacterium]MBT4148091.1 hypothetical protein [Candidatus Peregrinibacteria bacterium]MBT4365855.1 hypothetical protein [Candidatus Peregrinibacteria bacterium]MBT4456455.1 hypothetical protein [Candidatus Peregrinibacteria bacterium]
MAAIRLAFFDNQGEENQKGSRFQVNEISGQAKLGHLRVNAENPVTSATSHFPLGTTKVMARNAIRSAAKTTFFAKRRRKSAKKSTPNSGKIFKAFSAFPH